MAILALAAGENNVLNTHTYVSSSIAGSAIANLPKINDGVVSGTVAKGYEIRVEALSDGDIEIRTSDGRRVGYVPGWASVTVVAELGEVQEAGSKDFWRFKLLPNRAVSFFAAAGATYTAAEQNLINEMRKALIDGGWMKAE